MTTSLYQPGRAELAELLDGQPRYRVDQVWQGLYEKLATPAEMTNLSKALRARLDLELPPALTEVTRRVNDGGDTVKQLWTL
ncbi:MAG TPA: 23S rRNA (adenine(2503)-C(2))-methyltransferase RlmN, partial [Ilumatobacteraceae bacterium]